MKRLLLFVFVAIIGIKGLGQLSLLNSFDPAEAGSLCGIGYDPDSSHIWVYECFASQIHCYDTTGTFIKSFNIGGESANDVDFDFSSENFEMDGSTICAFDILFINGETDNADIYAIDRSSGEVIDTLNTLFGISHVVGGSWHHGRNSFFLIQDNVPGTADENTVAEIDAVTGDTLQTFQTTANFSVSYGDLEVCTDSGHLFIVSSDESSMAEYTPDGEFIQELSLPVGVGSLSGIAMDYTAGTAWVSSTNGTVYLLSGINCSCSASTATIAATACESYISPSGLYTWDEDGTYMDVVVNSTGCDSLITINLDITEISNGVDTQGGVLISTQDGGEYQWFDCDDKFFPIPNATGQSYEPETSGNFAVVITLNDCMATSDCIFIDPNSVAEFPFLSFLEVHPNPTKDNILISFSLRQKTEVGMEVRNVLGENILGENEWAKKEFAMGTHSVSLSAAHWPAGVYFVRLLADKQMRTLKVLKQ